ncbi:hypothetical protein PQX77_000800 [Marasmius sp. AFHP31]|nr:hypothetical protein PQX77_000800 [Marasmius sp. AFHP31]
MSTVKNIKKLPKAPSVVDISHPCPRIIAAIGVLDRLALSMKVEGRTLEVKEAVAWVKSAWKSTLSFWFKLLLQDIILAEEGPLTPQGVDVLERTLTTIPIILNFPKELEADLADIVTSSSFLLPLLTASWCKTACDGHPSWRLWSNLMFDHFSHTPNCNESPMKHIVFSPYTTNDGQTDDKLASKLLRHIALQAEKFPKMSLPELQDLRAFMECIGEQQKILSERCKPLDNYRIREAAMRTLVRLIRRCVCKRRLPPDARLDSEEAKTIAAIANRATFDLMRTLHDHGWISEGMSAGMVKILFKAQSWIFRSNEIDSLRARHTFCDCYNLILQRISSFLPYPRVLKLFLRAVAKIQSIEGLEVGLKEKSLDLWKRWEMVKTRAAVFQDLRKSFKERHFFHPESCSYPKVLSFYTCVVERAMTQVLYPLVPTKTLKPIPRLFT